jgi:GT2 family glycosyltransferase
MLDLSIIIVNYNTKEFLKKCISSLLYCVSKNVSYEIIVVDNASSDESPTEILNLKSQIPNLRIILNRKNVGFSKANNQGVKISKESKYVLFLNSDTIMQNQTIEEMINFMDTHKDAGASTCKLIMPNGKIDDATHRGFPTPWNSFSHFLGLEKMFPTSKLFAGYSLGWMNLERTHMIDVLAGAFMLVRRVAGEQAKWWDEDYFFYGEDIDFCYMLKEKGWKIYYVPTVSIMHYKGVSGGIKNISKEITTANEETKNRVTKWRFNAMRIFYKKHYKQKYPWIVNLLVNIGISIRENI